MKQFYSQDGEDAVMWSLFGDDTPGYFVEVGALDGRRFSNCYSFELAGWKGVCVEPHHDYIELVRRNRPGSTCVHAAVSDHDADAAPFFANRRGTLSTLDASKETLWKQRFARYFTGFDTQRVPVRTLTRILDEAGAPAPVDVVSIDVEGHELNVLRGLDFDKYRPRVLVIEALDAGAAAELEAFMSGKGYRKARQISSNLLFCRDEADAAVVAAAKSDVPRVWLPHPLDEGQETGVQRPAERTDRRRRPRPEGGRTTPSILQRIAARIRGTPTPAAEPRRPRRDPSVDRRRDLKYQPVEAGFHGDAYLHQLVAHLAPRAAAFIETGCNVGSTARYVARTFPHLRVLSCEADEKSFAFASQRLAECPGATVRHVASPQFLHDLHREEPDLFQQRNLYWLDAHGYGFRWPLRDEVAFITTTAPGGYILIDDFEVPGQPQFHFDQSEDQVCSFATVAPQLNPRHPYQLVYPTYNDRTSGHHELTGVGLIVFGDPDFALTESLARRFSAQPVTPPARPEPAP